MKRGKKLSAILQKKKDLSSESSTTEPWPFPLADTSGTTIDVNGTSGENHTNTAMWSGRIPPKSSWLKTLYLRTKSDK